MSAIRKIDVKDSKNSSTIDRSPYRQYLKSGSIIKGKNSAPQEDNNFFHFGNPPMTIQADSAFNYGTNENYQITEYSNSSGNEKTRKNQSLMFFQEGIKRIREKITIEHFKIMCQETNTKEQYRNSRLNKTKFRQFLAQRYGP
mmetsp:Transcript_18655/g.17751  ORF Transcript_18655/g.17751 Transcript_18655/m.17751 type:complete len:143 (-) Transcript_18655:461-889(-)